MCSQQSCKQVSELAQHHVELDSSFIPLEHNFVWIVDAENGHIVQKFLIELEWSKFNNEDPVGAFKTLVEELRKTEQV